MGILVGLAPWIVYWVLVANAPFTVSVLVALAVAIAGWALERSRRGTLEIGAVGTFVVLAALTFTTSQSFHERWLLPLSHAALFAVALAGVLVGKPFVAQTVRADQSADAVQSEALGRATTLLTWMWIVVFAAMTVSTLIPSLVLADATILDSTRPLSFICYWVVPIALLALAAIASNIMLATMTRASDAVARKTTFVAYDEATIDELYYLAQEHVKREVGAGKEAYDIKVGGLGTPLVGDDSRKSWPATYKVRERTRP
ncbi:DUF3159 domain-containing protein [Mycobacterium branderi]|uniref:Uncharacterized protein n=1 Tax=Mycobacterium branderi TaxID=43348 RepID=A0A7I7WAU9_9MYCO|nr:hypothetical protein [Mycobacterium branderi]MCV7231561.1 hypothetical protein [Mycobacterium branderi]ORA37370.1 hypothetical protein BST20_12965 [Mycobacterium branderi]BBZ13623.1 hypothetical protein MBRA_38180 [Mycobacterium branderi]